MEPHATRNLTDADRQRVRRAAVLSLVVLLLAFSGLSLLALKWASEPGTHQKATSSRVEVSATGDQLEVEGEVLEFLAFDDGSLLALDVTESTPRAGDTFTLWSLPLPIDAIDRPLGAVYSPSLKSTFSSRELHPGVARGSDVLWIAFFGFLASVLSAVGASLTASIQTAHHGRRTLPLHGAFFPTLRHALSKSYAFNDSLVAAMVVFHVISGLLLASVTYRWFHPKDIPLEVEFLGVILVLLSSALVLGAFFFVTFPLARLFYFSFFSRVSWGPLSDVTASSLDWSLPLPVRIETWLERSGWHEETGSILGPDFEGTLSELSKVSRELGPVLEKSS